MIFKFADETAAWIHKDVEEILGQDTSGHAVDHIDRVYRLAVRFA